MRRKMTAGLMALACFGMMLTGCGGTAESSGGSAETQPAGADENAAVPADNTALASGESGGTFIITLYPDAAPISCENFQNLVESGFYNGVGFHRVVEGFMAQGGDPTGTGMGDGSLTPIKGEFASNGVDNPLSHTRGTVSMARTNQPDSATSQFFICYDDSCTFLDGNYAAFGVVTEGMEVVDSFLQVDRSLNSNGEIASPNTPITMQSVVMIEDDADGNPRVQVTMNDFLNQ